MPGTGYDKAFLTTQIQRASDIPRTDALYIKTNFLHGLKPLPLL